MIFLAITQQKKALQKFFAFLRCRIFFAFFALASFLRIFLIKSGVIVSRTVQPEKNLLSDKKYVFCRKN